MEFITKAIEKIKEGGLKEMLREMCWIYRYGMLYKAEIFWYIFLGLFGTLMSLAGSVLSKYVIDAVTGHDTGIIMQLAVFYILMQLLRIGSNALNGRISAKIEIKVDQEIRADVYDKIMDADWQAMSLYHSGDLLNRVDNDVSTVAHSVLGWVPSFVTGAFQFLGTLAVILYYDITLAFLALLSAPATLIVSRTLMRKMREHNKKMREVSSEVMTFNEESFQNIQAIKSFGLTEAYRQKLRDVQKNYKDVRLSYNMFSIITSSFMALMGLVISVSCYAWGIYRLWAGFITYGTMTLFLQLSGSLTAAFSALVALVPNMISAATAAGRIMAVTELPREHHEDDEAAAAFRQENGASGVTVRLKDVCFRYSNGKKVLEGVNLVAKPGEIVAIVGPSGEGKTTIFRLLLGLVYPQRGEITVCGKNADLLLKVSASTRSIFSYVPQGNAMFAGTVAENLRVMKPNATDEELWEVLRLACADKFVGKHPEGLDSPIRERGVGFSEGQLQRISIARALLTDAPILLLDEATSALDADTEQKVLSNIMSYHKNSKTCIITTHRQSVLEICNRVYRISDRKAEGGRR